MAIIRMGYVDRFQAGTLIEGAYTPFDWNNDEAVSSGNMNIKLRENPGSAFFLYTTHHGLCIRDREYNGYDDSDFYMLVWDEEAQAPYEIMFATTRGWSYPCYGSSADATPEVMAAYNAWSLRESARLRARDAHAARLAAIREAEGPHKGAVCKVARGRKVAQGTTGRVLGLSERRGYRGGSELWALLDTGAGFESVLAQHLDLIAASPAARQAAFDSGC